jgi:predicted permease
MTGLTRWFRGLRALFRKRDVEREMAQEMRSHLELEAAALARSGLTLDEAQRAARAAFGGVERFKQEAREGRTLHWMEQVAQDLRYALRTLRRSPAFTVAAACSLALGIGATTVIFTVVDHVVLRPLAFADVNRLVVIREKVTRVGDPFPTWPANAGHFMEWRRGCTTCEGLAAIKPASVTLTESGDPERLGAARVSANLFALLGVRPALGRFFTAEQDQPGRGTVALISDGLWRRRFGADTTIVGHAISINNVQFVVQGVLPADFRFPKNHELGEGAGLPAQIDVFVPLALTPFELASPGGYDYIVIARLKRGVSPSRAAAEISAIAVGTARSAPEDRHAAVLAVPIQEMVVGPARRALLLLLSAVGAMLLLMCVNLANLFAARNEGRSRESALRVALGAGRGRLVRLALTETVVLALVGGAAGIIVSRWGLKALVRTAPATLPRLNEVQIDARVLAVAIAVSALVGLAFGIAPALRSAHIAPGDILKAGGRTATAGRAGLRTRALLIGTQVGLSALLLCTAGLFLASFVRVLHVDKGFDEQRVLTIDVVLPRSYDTSERRTLYFDQAISRLGALPGVVASGFTTMLPLRAEAEVNDLVAENEVSSPHPQRLANVRFVSPGYFSALAVPLRKGRTMAETDRGRNVALLSERTARMLWPGEDPIGRRVIVSDDQKRLEIVGITADVRTSGLEREASPTVFRPYWEVGYGFGSIVLRTAGDPAALAAGARAALRQMDATVPVPQIRTMATLLSDAVAQRRFQLVLLALFALTAVATASVGIYGIMSHSLAARRAEIGIRLALGARPADVHRLVLREGLGPAALGLGAGIALSLATGGALTSLLFEARPNDPSMMLAVVALLGGVSVVACYLPARKATRGDPVAALRTE